MYYFQIWNKKEVNIIISSRVINRHMGPMYIGTPYIFEKILCYIQPNSFGKWFKQSEIVYLVRNYFLTGAFIRKLKPTQCLQV